MNTRVSVYRDHRAGILMSGTAYEYGQPRTKRCSRSMLKCVYMLTKRPLNARASFRLGDRVSHRTTSIQQVLACLNLG